MAKKRRIDITIETHTFMRATGSDAWPENIGPESEGLTVDALRLANALLQSEISQERKTSKDQSDLTHPDPH